jgi:hypothetical protein
MKLNRTPAFCGFSGAIMVERRIELDRRFRRRAKMRKLKHKLTTAQGEEREKILYKISRLSPWWTEPAKTPAK